MSIEATRWAYSQITGSSARKAVLVNLADRCGDDNTCYPSIGRIANDTELNEKTVRKALHELCEHGFIFWTGETKGLGAKVYKLAISEVTIPTVFGTPNFTTPTNIGTPKNGCTPLPKTDVPPTNFGSTPLPILGVKPINEPTMNLSSESINEKSITHTHETQNFENSKSEQNLVFESSVRESQFSNERRKSSESNLVCETTVTAKISKKSDEGVNIKPPVKANDLVALGVSPQVAHDFLRKKKNHEITHTALVRNQNQAKKANLTLAQALEFATEADWQAFTADYYFNRVQKSQNTQGQAHANYQSNYQNHASVKSSAELMAERNQADYDAWVKRLVGASGESSTNPNDFGFIYDVETVVPVENEKTRGLEFTHSPSVVGSFN